MSRLRHLQKHCWILVLVFALSFLAADNYFRMAVIRFVTEASISEVLVPQKDPQSPTGYALGVREMVLPEMGVDGRHWVMQTQQMLAGEGARIRKVDYDNAPLGREVHWSSSFRWWLAAVAWVHSSITGEFLPISVEQVSPYAGTLLLVLILLVLTPFVAWRFGAVPASLFALAGSTVMPFYEYFSAGYPDHHGIVATFGMLTVLFLAAGGAGWFRNDAADPSSLSPEEQVLQRWLPSQKAARRWFIASAVAGGGGLWVSAASEAPVMIGVGLGALLACGFCARGKENHHAWSCDPTLWRLWGVAGFCTSLGFYLLEYFPSHFGMRLEVNHPLYALAWLGAGDLLCRACQGIRDGRLICSWKNLSGIFVSLLAVGVLPACIVLAKEQTFYVSDAFLWALHEDYIMEFRNLFRHLQDPRFTVAPLANNNLLPLFGMAFMLLLAASSRLARPWKALLYFTLLPGIVLFVLAVTQVRWQGISCGVWFAAMIMTTTVMTLPGTGFRWSWRWKIAVPLFFLFVILPYPWFAAPLWIRDFQQGTKFSSSDLSWAVGRDVAHYLRHRLGNQRGVVLSGPTVTTSLVYSGGMRGLGTLYWENIAGLKAAAEIYGAPSEEKAFELIKKRGVTHIVIFSWDPFDEEYAKLARGLRRDQKAPEDAFMVQLLRTASIPYWLRPLPYSLPEDALFKDYNVLVFEVVPDQTMDLALVRTAQFLEEKGNLEKATANLALALERNPQFLPALIALAHLHYHFQENEEFARALEQIRAGLSGAGELRFEDRVDLARILTAGKEHGEAAAQFAACLDQAGEQDLRMLQSKALYDLANFSDAAGVSVSHPEIVRKAMDLLPPAARGNLVLEMAGRAAKTGQHAKALALYREGLATMPDFIPLLTNMAWLLATSPDSSVRNGAEALELAQRARQMGNQAPILDAMSCAYATMGDFKNAVEFSRQALVLAEGDQQTELAASIRMRLQAFEEGKAYRESAVPATDTESPP